VTEFVDLDPHAYATAKLANVITHHRAAQLCEAQRPDTPELRPRERQCLELCARGRTDSEIARELGVSLATVRRHIESARIRFGVSTRVQAALRAVLSGQIKP
jgi:DNA-binding CsgD family transcriptional regulator